MLIRFNAAELMNRLVPEFDREALGKFDLIGGLDNSDMYAVVAFSIMKRSLNYTPVDTGALRKSIYVKKVSDYYEVGYTASYAPYVHEIIDNYHNPPTKAKFLEDAAFEIMTEYGEIGTYINVSIEYDPLRVYIGGGKLPGASLIEVKQKEKENRNSEAMKELLDYFSVENHDEIYNEKMEAFFYYYYTVRKKKFWDIADLWADRNRHD